MRGFVLKTMVNVTLYKLISGSNSLYCFCFVGALLSENAEEQREDGRAESGMAFGFVFWEYDYLIVEIHI